LFSADAFAANQTSTSGVDILGEFHWFFRHKYKLY
jgi:hypothetical protein